MNADVPVSSMIDEDRIRWLPLAAAIASISVVGIAIGLGMPLLSVILEAAAIRQR